MNAMTEPLLFKQTIQGIERELVSFATHPAKYQHWTLTVEGDVARLKLDINEDGGIKPGYKLKLNSYDLGVDIELHDAINRIRFEHPAVKVVVFESGKEKIWCSGANIYMLGLSTHAWKVNFCKFTNETRNGLEDSSRLDGLKAIAAVTGACAGGGYELALACDRSYQLMLPDDAAKSPTIAVGQANFGSYPMVTGQHRLGRRFYDEDLFLSAIRAQLNQPLDADAAFALGLITANPDDIDWGEEIRIAVEERVAMSPDALTGLEANLRFNGPENMFTRVFGRLTAWQNWIFQRPNAVGEKGALQVYGKGEKAIFDWTRV